MREFISRKAAVEAIVFARDKLVAEQPYGWEYEYAGFNSAILALPTPTEDMRPVVKAYWIGEGDGYADGKMVYDVWNCSNCGYTVDEGDNEPPHCNFCPNCGADMREVLGDDNS